MSLAQPAEDPSKERGTLRPSGLWDRCCGMDSAVSVHPKVAQAPLPPHCPPPLRQMGPPMSMGAQALPSLQTLPLVSPVALGQTRPQPGLRLPVGGHRGAARGPPAFPRRLGGDTLGEAPGPPRGGCWQCLGRPQPQAAEMWRPQACLQSSFLQSRRCSSANVSDPLEADTGCGRTGEPARPAPGAAAEPGLGGREGGSRPVR